jgi:hypothetical protein
MLLSMVSRNPATHEIWQGSDGSYQSGMARRLALPGPEPVFIVAARPFEQTRLELEKRLGATIALADLRGRSVGDQGSPLVRTWRDHGQVGHIERLDGRDSVISSTPLVSGQGLPLATLVAARPQIDQSDTPHRLYALLATLGLGLTLGGLLFYLLRSLRPHVRSPWSARRAKCAGVSHPIQALCGASEPPVEPDETGFIAATAARLQRKSQRQRGT